MLRQNLATVAGEIALRAASSVMLRPEMTAGLASAARAIRCSLGRKPGSDCLSRTRTSSVIGPGPLLLNVATLAPSAGPLQANPFKAGQAGYRLGSWV